MHFLLKLKSWQLFMLVGIPLLIPQSSIIGVVAMYFSLFISLSWIYTIGTTMQSLIPNSSKPSIKYFKVYFLIMPIALIIPCIALLSSNNSIIGSAAIAGIVITAITFICACGFAGRMLESVTEGEIVGNSDALKAILCFVFYPLGLWHIQPAVRRVLLHYNNQAV
jgi:glucan phosphoethanolaminetransferase (alkaline phosphatase superfamily)